MSAQQALDFARDASGIGVYQVNLKTGMLSADDRYFAMLGYLGDEIKPTLHWWHDALHPDDVDAVNTSLSELMAGKSDRLQEVYRMRHRDGHWVWVEDRARIFERDKDGEPVLTFGVHMDVSPHQHAEQPSAIEAEQDQLTGLHNRHSFLHSLRRVHAQSQRTQRSYCVEKLDLDLDKSLKESNGHLMVNRVLTDCAKRLRQSLRAGDWAARWSGEEFVILMPDTKAEQARHSMKRLRETLGRACFGGLEPAIQVTVTAGIAQSRPDDQSHDAVIKRADAALYTAKHLGRDQVFSTSALETFAQRVSG
jgi:diguanylate cyclase (GGDEF)-like protein/PAS domain S-box-containing protein